MAVNILRRGMAGMLLMGGIAAAAGQVVQEEVADSALHGSESWRPGEVLSGAGHYLRESAAVIVGKASYYSRRLHGRLSATGEVFRNEMLTAASNIFPLGSWLAVRHADGGCVVVRVNDRMPGRHPGRILDLSYAAARQLGIIARGVAAVEARLLPADFDGRLGGCSRAFAD